LIQTSGYPMVSSHFDPGPLVEPSQRAKFKTAAAALTALWAMYQLLSGTSTAIWETIWGTI
jgi:hypothetical protein